MQLVPTSEDDTAICIACQGDISQSRFPSNVNNPLEDLLGPDCYNRQVLLDFSQAGFIDSSGVGWLMVCHKRFLAGGGQLILHSIPPLISQVLQMLRLNTLFTIKPDRATALAQAADAKGKS
jgi:anti-sigma B factor antagonist